LQEREDDREQALSIEDRVAEYTREIREVQPDGPYNLIGWCASGPMTVELARGLQSSGGKVGMLALIDSSRPGYDTESRAEHERRSIAMRIRSMIALHRRRHQVLFGSDRTLRYIYRVICERIMIRRDRFVLRYGKLVLRLSQRLGVSAPHFLYNLSQLKLDSIAPYEGRITLFRATETDSQGSDPALGWGEVAKQGVDIVWTPGDHETMFKEPHVTVFARLVAEALEIGDPRKISLPASEPASAQNPTWAPAEQ
jgi:thioesterase domain-containing protein